MLFRCRRFYLQSHIFFIYLNVVNKKTVFFIVICDNEQTSLKNIPQNALQTKYSSNLSISTCAGHPVVTRRILYIRVYMYIYVYCVKVRVRRTEIIFARATWKRE